MLVVPKQINTVKKNGNSLKYKIKEIRHPSVGQSVGGSRLSTTTVNMKRICNMLSGEPDSPWRVHLLDSYATPAQDSSSVGYAFAATPFIAIREEKVNNV